MDIETKLEQFNESLKKHSDKIQNRSLTLSIIGAILIILSYGAFIYSGHCQERTINVLTRKINELEAIEKSSKDIYSDTASMKKTAVGKQLDSGRQTIKVIPKIKHDTIAIKIGNQLINVKDTKLSGWKRQFSTIQRGRIKQVSYTIVAYGQDTLRLNNLMKTINEAFNKTNAQQGVW